MTYVLLSRLVVGNSLVFLFWKLKFSKQASGTTNTITDKLLRVLPAPLKAGLIIVLMYCYILCLGRDGIPVLIPTAAKAIGR